MVVAIIALFIITLLTGTAIAVATQTSTSTTRDDNVKAELAAAEAGLHIASYRLGQLKPSETQCIGEAKAESEESKCKDSKESLGNGAYFRYKTTKPLKTGEECSGRTLSSIPANTTYRCVTAEGIVNGVEPVVRLQARVKGATAKSLFPIAGMVGLKKVVAEGAVSIPALVASDGEIVGTGSANFEQGYEVCSPGKFKPAAGEERRSSGVKIHGKNPEAVAGYEKTRVSTECPIEAEVPSGHPTAASNEDSKVSEKLTGPHHTWNSSKYEFSMEGDSAEDSLTLGESGKTTRYFFCSFKMPGGDPKLKIASGAKVEMFIGSPSEGTCASGTGVVNLQIGGYYENEAKSSSAFLIEMGGEGPFTFGGGRSGDKLEASVLAPKATMELSGSVEFKGAIVASELKLDGSTSFPEYSAESATLTNGTTSGYSRETWEQCVSGSSGSC